MFAFVCCKVSCALASCVRKCLIYGNETWPMKLEHEVKIDRKEIKCRVSGLTLKKGTKKRDFNQ